MKVGPPNFYNVFKGLFLILSLVLNRYFQPLIQVGHLEQTVLVGHLVADVAKDAVVAGEPPLQVMDRREAYFAIGLAPVAAAKGRGESAGCVVGLQGLDE